MSPDDAPAPAITAVRLTGSASREELPLLVLGPDHGHTALDLWSEVAAGLDDAFDVLAWDLPGHGYNAPPAPDAEPLTVVSLAVGVQRVVDDVLAQRGDLGGACAWAGVGIGAEVALHLRREHPARVSAAVVLDDIAPAERAAVLRRELLGEHAGSPAPPVLDERSRALVDLAAAAATGAGVEAATRLAREAGLSRAQVDEVLTRAGR